MCNRHIVFAKGGFCADRKIGAFQPPIAVLICFFFKFTNGETALASFGAELNVRSIQIPHFANARLVICNPTERTYNHQLTDTHSTTHRTLQHICKPHKANAQSQACKRAAILPTHPSPPTTSTKKLLKILADKNNLLFLDKLCQSKKCQR